MLSVMITKFYHREGFAESEVHFTNRNLGFHICTMSVYMLHPLSPFFNQLFQYFDNFGQFNYVDFPDMKMEYVSKEYSQHLTFYVNLETGKIVSVHLEGYTE